MVVAGLEAHHRSNSGRFHSTVEARVPPARVPGSTGRQDNKDGAGCSSRFTFRSTCSKDCGAHAAFSDVRRVTEPTPSQNGNGTAGFALLAGDEGEQFAQEVPLGESEEVHNSKREPTHRGGIVRRAPRESFGGEKSRGPQWLLKMSHCKASFLCGLCEAWSFSVRFGDQHRTALRSTAAMLLVWQT